MATTTETAKVGQPAPDFDMASTKNIEKLNENVRLSDYKGKWLVLLFYPLASDQTKDVSRAYGVLIENQGIALRGLFVIDPEGTLRYAVVHDLNVGRSAEETLRVIQALQTGGLCQAEWKPGQKTLSAGA